MFRGAEVVLVKWGSVSVSVEVHLVLVKDTTLGTDALYSVKCPKALALSNRHSLSRQRNREA